MARRTIGGPVASLHPRPIEHDLPSIPPPRRGPVTVAETAADRPSTVAAPPQPTGLADGAPDVELLDVTKRFGEVVAVDAMTLRDPARIVHQPARSVGLRQDDHAPDDRRLRAADRGRDPPRRPADRRRAAVQAQRQHRLPALRALPPHGRRPERRLRAAPEEGRQGGGAATGEPGPRARPPRRLRAAANLGAVRRPAAARRARPGPREPPDRPAPRRAARRARPQAPQGRCSSS